MSRFTNRRTARPPRFDDAEYRRNRPLALARDNHQCQLRLTGCTGKGTEADHVIPRWQGGTNALHNLRAACPSCNRKKGAAEGARIRNAMRRRITSRRW